MDGGRCESTTITGSTKPYECFRLPCVFLVVLEVDIGLVAREAVEHGGDDTSYVDGSESFADVKMRMMMRHRGHPPGEPVATLESYWTLTYISGSRSENKFGRANTLTVGCFCFGHKSFGGTNLVRVAYPV